MANQAKCSLLHLSSSLSWSLCFHLYHRKGLRFLVGQRATQPAVVFGEVSAARDTGHGPVIRCCQLTVAGLTGKSGRIWMSAASCVVEDPRIRSVPGLVPSHARRTVEPTAAGTATRTRPSAAAPRIVEIFVRKMSPPTLAMTPMRSGSTSAAMAWLTAASVQKVPCLTPRHRSANTLPPQQLPRRRSPVQAAGST